MNNSIYTTKLNNNRTVVLAKNDRYYGIMACTFVNFKQASMALERLQNLANINGVQIKAAILDKGRVKFIQILEA
jgi:hypothetical protein